MLESEPDLDSIIVPVGGGSGLAGAALVAHEINPAIKVIGVQSAQSQAAYQSWKQRQLVEQPNTTLAEGLATGTAFELPQSMMWKYVKEFVLVSDEQILKAMFWMLERTRSLAEPAGAAPLAAAYQLREELKGKKIALVCSGGNATPAQIQMALFTPGCQSAV
jgi:threonine dehydratase